MSKKYQVTNWCHSFIKQHVKEGDCCIDATAGNGNDTEILCELTGSTGKVYAFDIQEIAVQSVKERLSKKGLSAQVILDGHQNMANYVDLDTPVSCIVFNFGYLPTGDHQVSTNGDTSIQAIEMGLSLLKKDGLMSLCIYSGGDTGFDEKNMILNYLKTLDGKKYLVIVSEYYNRPNNPPIPVIIIKL